MLHQCSFLLPTYVRSTRPEWHNPAFSCSLDMLNYLKHCSVLSNNGLSHFGTMIGIYVEGLDTGDDDPQRVSRRWLKPIYTAAPTVVYR